MDLTPIIHKRCGQVAFHYDRPGGPEDPRADRARLLDGSTPKSGDQMRCGSCDANVTVADLTWAGR
jgi:hypothetical protein